MPEQEFFLIKEFKNYVIYLPVGVLKLADDFRKRAIEVGRAEFLNQVRTSKAMGEMAIKFGVPQLKDELSKYIMPISSLKGFFNVPTQKDENLSQEVSQRNFLNGQAGVANKIADLPIANYDSLAASQVLSRLESLSSEDLEKIATYEKSHRQRRTILSKIAQLQNS